MSEESRKKQESAYVVRCRKAYVKWIEATALLEAYHHAQNRQGHAINFHAIKKSREKAEMDEVDGNSNRFAVGKSSV